MKKFICREFCDQEEETEKRVDATDCLKYDENDRSLFYRGEHEVEIISVADYRIHPCTGCNGCYTREGNICVQDDDMAEIYDRLARADTVVIASPV
jgi:hypothetical protein